MKVIRIAIFFSLSLLCFTSGYSQLFVNAGADTAFCGSEIALDLESLPKGVYFYKLVSENHSTVSGKFVIE